jgi:hypothetical protein
LPFFSLKFQLQRKDVSVIRRQQSEMVATAAAVMQQLSLMATVTWDGSSSNPSAVQLTRALVARGTAEQWHIVNDVLRDARATTTSTARVQQDRVRFAWFMFYAVQLSGGFY